MDEIRCVSLTFALCTTILFLSGGQIAETAQGTRLQSVDIHTNDAGTRYSGRLSSVSGLQLLPN